MTREIVECDVLIVGGGPAGLSAAIRLRQLQPNLSVIVIEKAAEIGAHTLSGAVLDPRALNELLPDWLMRDPPAYTPVKKDHFLLLTEKKACPLPVPTPLKNHGNFIIRLGHWCRWLASQAEALGVQIYPGFPASEILYTPEGHVRGVATRDQGLNKQGEETSLYQPGIELLAKYTLLAEGCRGSLSQILIRRFELDKNCDPQTYGLGIKELWEIDPTRHQAGHVIHSVGWPLESSVYGGSFLYHLGDKYLAVGFVVGLDYQNPTLDPFQELQRFKTHPTIRDVFEGGQRIGYGARALVEGGFQSLPELYFPGGLIIGDSAGFLNVPKIKGIHMAMKSGMTAAETIHAAESAQNSTVLASYSNRLKETWVWDELYRARNIRPGFRRGLWGGLAYAALDTYLFRGHAPWTFHHFADHLQLKPQHNKIHYPKPDGQLTFDKSSSVDLSCTRHKEDQPCHLQLHNPATAIDVNLAVYGAPEQYYCPANVYEIIGGEKPRLQINASNCLHCKTCDIKDPTQNIVWSPPEGGGGPHYDGM